MKKKCQPIKNQALNPTILAKRIPQKKAKETTKKEKGSSIVAGISSFYDVKGLGHQFSSCWTFHRSFPIYFGDKQPSTKPTQEQKTLTDQIEMVLDSEICLLSKAMGTVQKGNAKPLITRAHYVQLYVSGLNSIGCDQSQPADESAEDCIIVQLTGAVEARTCIFTSHPSQHQILQGLKSDLTRSFRSRFQLWSEEIEQEAENSGELSLLSVPTSKEGTAAPQIVSSVNNAFAWPSRVFVQPSQPEAHFYMGDYLVPSESLQDVVTRFNDLLGITLSTDQLFHSSEREEATAVRPKPSYFPAEPGNRTIITARDQPPRDTATAGQAPNVAGTPVVVAGAVQRQPISMLTVGVGAVLVSAIALLVAYIH